MGSISERVRATDADISPHRDADFTAFFQDSYAPLVRTLFAVVQDREQARDIAQEAFIQLFARWRRVSHYERPDAWLRRVAIRMAVRALRRERQRPLLERQLEPSNLAGPVDLDVLRAIGQLPPQQRTAVVLFYLEDRPVSEIAAILACSEVTAKVHLHRARKRLAGLLDIDDERGSNDVA